jgi:phosphatidylserine/phosphatidylglycerophosphate/cardiolipin synthase-like enzyme
LILGWDIESRVRLFRDGRIPGLPSRLAPLLKEVISRRPELHVYLLPWDFATLYLLEREPPLMTLLNLRWPNHGRLHIHWDGNHPVGACHHQKLVVVDDRIAFTGGLDLTSHRWDTPEHRPENAGRETSFGIQYGPFHDVQVAVDGEAAAALGELARRRWERATGERLAAPTVDDDTWPSELTPDFSHVHVAIARTEHDDPPGTGNREVEELFAASLRSARTIYIECNISPQADRGCPGGTTGAQKGPEIVIVTTLRCSGWLEELAMGVQRARMLGRLRAADRFGRLRVYCAMADTRRHIHIEVHSKVMVIDDAFLRVGSANLTNRSMALDTECDVAIEAGGEGRIREGIRRFRNRLLGEHLGTSPDHLADAVEAHASLIRAIEALRGGSPRSLVPLDGEVAEPAAALVPEMSIADPERPLESLRLWNISSTRRARRLDQPPAMRCSWARY